MSDPHRPHLPLRTLPLVLLLVFSASFALAANTTFKVVDENGAPLPCRIHLTGSTREFPSPMKFLGQARATGRAWIDIEKPFWWDVPLWLASGRTDSIGLANNHMCHASMYETEAWGRPRDITRLPPPRGNGFWTQEIYYRILDTGLRVPPSAGSASGVLPNPLGYNRAYAHVGGPENFTWPNWFASLEAGRSFVTNGPLLLVNADARLPGHVFKSNGGNPLTLTLDIALTALDPVPAIEVIQNGRVVQSLELDPPVQFPFTVRKTATLNVTGPGWFLVRAVTGLDHTFRFAPTAPFYVEFPDDPARISRAATQFFVDWTGERIARVPDALSTSSTGNGSSPSLRKESTRCPLRAMPFGR